MVKYRGGKSKEIPEILPFIPQDYDRYVEPFLGGGALFFYLEPENALLNDLNKPLMSFYAGVRDDFSVVKSELEALSDEYERNRSVYESLKKQHPDERVHDENEDLYYRIRDMFNDKAPKELSEAAIYYFINKTAYSGMIRYNSKGEFNVPYGRYKNMNADQVSTQHSELLQKSELMTGDYQKVFDLCTKDDFIFLDPPYDCSFSDYGNKETADGFSSEQHERLARAFFELDSKALMVIGKTDLTYRLYKDAIVHEYDKNYAVNIRNRFKSKSKHIIVANYS